MRTLSHCLLIRGVGKRYGQRTGLLVIATSGDDVLSRLRAGEATGAALLSVD